MFFFLFTCALFFRGTWKPMSFMDLIELSNCSAFERLAFAVETGLTSILTVFLPLVNVGETVGFLLITDSPEFEWFFLEFDYWVAVYDGEVAYLAELLVTLFSVYLASFFDFTFILLYWN